MTKAYKIVREVLGGFFSMSLTGYSLEYKIGEKTKPKIGKLFAFKTLEDAQIFKNMNFENRESYPIFLCEAKRSKVQHTKRASTMLRNDIFLFWQEKRTKKSAGINWCDLPEGTVFCDEITLIGKINETH